LEICPDEVGGKVAGSEYGLGVDDGDEVELKARLRGCSVVLGSGEIPEQRERGIPRDGVHTHFRLRRRMATDEEEVGHD
jgi:hypothetical protein